MGAYSNTYNVQALSNAHLDAMFTFRIDIDEVDLIEGNPELTKKLGELDASKWGNAQAIRYLAKGTTKAKLDTFKKEMQKVAELQKKYVDSLYYAGEWLIQECVYSPVHNKTVDTAGAIKLNRATHARQPNIYRNRIAEIKKGKSKTKSCQHCTNSFVIDRLIENDVLFCRTCGAQDPFGNATFSKKIKSATKNAQKARDNLEKAISRAMKKCPYMYKVIWVYPDDEGYNKGYDEDPFLINTTPVALNQFFYGRTIHELQRGSWLL